ncbi:MAG: hypothetical protein HON53_04210, partial [Planctomycetaceae bacterium]|nr:hypothetical protein [Planctomycetaceae bacterium]
AENQLAFIEFLRHIADGVIEPVEAVKAYHAVLEKLNVRPNRSLEEDLTLQTAVMGYGGNAKTVSLPGKNSVRTQPDGFATTQQGEPDFAAMSASERLAYHRERLNRKLGE